MDGSSSVHSSQTVLGTLLMDFCASFQRVMGGEALPHRTGRGYSGMLPFLPLAIWSGCRVPAARRESQTGTKTIFCLVIAFEVAFSFFNFGDHLIATCGRGSMVSQ